MLSLTLAEAKSLSHSLPSSDTTKFYESHQQILLMKVFGTLDRPPIHFISVFLDRVVTPSSTTD